MDTIGEFSCLLSKAMDTLGYNKECILTRQRCYKQRSKRINEVNIKHNSVLEVVLAGSRGDGTCNLDESDQDIMYCFKRISCYENTNDFIETDVHEKCVYKTDVVPPGYCHIEVQENITNTRPRTILEKALLQDARIQCRGSNNSLISNSKFMANVGTRYKDFKRNGPAITLCHVSELDTLPMETFTYRVDRDYVYAIPVQCPNVLKQWSTRQRHFEWPVLKDIEGVSNIPGQLVAVGSKESETPELEWRFCFIHSERILVASLNDTQLKLLCLLKIIGKQILKPACAAITSFVLKNIVFWMAETYSTSMFYEENLCNLVFLSLIKLKRSIKMRHMPYYMIPGRNLYSAKLVEGERKTALKVLTKLLETGPAFMYQMLPEMQRLSDTMLLVYRSPQDALRIQECRLTVYNYDMCTSLFASDNLFSDTSTTLVVCGLFVSDICSRFQSLTNICEDELQLIFNSDTFKYLFPDPLGMFSKLLEDKNVVNTISNIIEGAESFSFLNYVRQLFLYLLALLR